MFCVKKYKTSLGLLVAICDSELVNKELSFEGGKIKVNESFYCEEIVDSEDKIIPILRQAVSLNLLGNKIVRLALRLGLVHKDAIMYFRHNEESIAYAIVQVMRF